MIHTPRIFFDPRVWPMEYRALEMLQLDEAIVVGFDVEHSAAALGEIVMARRRGIPVAAYCAYREPLETLTHNVNASIAHTTHRDLQIKQIGAFISDALVLDDGKKPSEMAKVPPFAQNILAFTVRMADLMLLATPHEVARLETISDKRVLRYAFLEAPAVQAAPKEHGVVLYAPTLVRAQLAGYEFALRARGITAQVISAENARDIIEGRFIVMPEWWRGLAARSFANAGFGVVVPKQGGAEVFHSGIATFDARDMYSIGDALEICWSRPHAAPMLASAPPQAVLEADRCKKISGALVSVIVRTANRPHYLRRALSSIRRQSYRSIEIILVNNAGEDVRELATQCAGDLPVRYVALEQAVDVGAALNAGAKAATGAYVAYLDDDDILYPDHVARCVDTLEQAECDLVYTNCVGEYSQMQDGKKQIMAMQVYTDNIYRIEDLHIGNIATIHSVVHRRSLFERFGYIDESLTVTEDWELWLRMAVGGARLARINRPTCEYSWRYDPANPNTSISRLEAFADAYKVIIERYASHTSDRPDTIGLKQANNYAHQQKKAAAVRENPALATGLVMNDLLPTAVPVEGISDDVE